MRRHLWTTPKGSTYSSLKGCDNGSQIVSRSRLLSLKKKCFRKIKFRPKKKSFHFHPSTSEKWKRMLNEINFVLFALSSDDTFFANIFLTFFIPDFCDKKDKRIFLHGCTFQANYLPVKGLNIEIEVLETHKQGRPQT